METYTDRMLTCVQCNEEFTFSAEDQEHHAKMGYANEPKRCQPCRAARKRNEPGQNSNWGDAPREFHETVCGDCGRTARVPFKPRGDRPVYCSDCFSKRR